MAKLRLRKKFKAWVWRTLAMRSLGSAKGTLRINRRTKLSKYTHVGDNFNSNGLKVYGRGNVQIGDNFHCGFGCAIFTDNHNINGDSLPYDDTIVVKDVVLGNNIWLGVNVTILPGANIGDGAVIQAGSVVTGKIQRFAIAGGHPAKQFSSRNEEHYKNLESQGKFH